MLPHLAYSVLETEPKVKSYTPNLAFCFYLFDLLTTTLTNGGSSRILTLLLWPLICPKYKWTTYQVIGTLTCVVGSGHGGEREALAE